MHPGGAHCPGTHPARHWAVSMPDENKVLTGAPRFAALWLRCAGGASAPEAVATHTRLCEGYRQPWRHYHSLAHIEHCLREFDATKADMAGPDEVELALWYHDAVYQPGDARNEQRSAELFAEDARGRLPAPLVAEVCALIMATTHLAPPTSAQARWVVDIDLSSFGLPWPGFLRDSRAVRAEMEMQNDALYLAAHGCFLRGLLARPRIFSTDYFHARCEQRARDNIMRLLDAYAAGTRL